MVPMTLGCKSVPTRVVQRTCPACQPRRSSCIALVAPADVNASSGVLQHAFGELLLVLVDVVGFAKQSALRRQEEAAGVLAKRREVAIVLCVEVGEKAYLDMGSQLGAVTAEVLIDENSFKGGAGRAAGFGFDVGAYQQERWAIPLIGDRDLDDRSIGEKGVGGAPGTGASGLVS